ncbi:MAG: AMP-binding protein, partial [Gordonia sp. (in: high G+C Gram-positive bacteria)]|nr:AMP-binding protein [Gordonia sp. (in: high G+C Gram-positive bacteria)]
IRADELPRPIDLDQLAYVIYTSGSTGVPKGVLVTHRGLAAVHDELGARMSPGTASRVLHFASPSFDASVLEFLMAAAGAATLVIVPTTVYGGGELQDFLARREVTHAFITPAAVATMSPRGLPALSALAVGGEAVPADLIRAWSPDRTLLNVYGPTETTVITTGSDPLAPDSPVTIGRPNNGVAAVVLDSRLHPVPAGVTGELYLLGPQVTRGYRNRSALTSTRYPAAPMVLGEEFAGQRMYRTGDLVRWRTDPVDASRSLDYAGRADGQVQVRGFRVELGEIDEVLTSHISVRASVTVAEGTSGNTVLHSYVVLEHHETATEPGSDTPAAVRRAAARRLPRHMVPATVTVLDRLPLTAVGKIDRAALPAPQLPTRTAVHAPVDHIESRIAQAFATVLRVGNVARDDNFFDVGGDSLRATALAEELRTAGCPVTVADVFAAPTPAELAAAVGRDTGDGDAAALAPVLTLRQPSANSGKAPLFAIHPAIGLAWSFTSLLPHIDDDRAVYGLQNPALSGDAPATSLADLAADYVRRIRERVPHGPYRLVGWSLGGVIAHEVAVALQELGEDVERLTILDSYVLAQHPEMARRESLLDLLGEFGIDTAEMAAIPDQAALVDAVRSGGGPLASLSADRLSAIRSTFESAGGLVDCWRPRVFDGDAVFVSATRTDHQISARTDWIDRVTGRLVDVRVDCTHARLLQPENVTEYRHVIEADTTAAPDRGRDNRQEESR